MYFVNFVLQEAYGLSPDNIVTVVSDTAPAMGAFGRLLYDKHKIFHVYCSAHVLELTTGMAFDMSDALDCMKDARSLIGHFNSSSQATAELMKIQTRARPLHVIQDVATRWWSTYAMICRLLELKEAI